MPQFWLEAISQMPVHSIHIIQLIHKTRHHCTTNTFHEQYEKTGIFHKINPPWTIGVQCTSTVLKPDCHTVDTEFTTIVVPHICSWLAAPRTHRSYTRVGPPQLKPPSIQKENNSIEQLKHSHKIHQIQDLIPKPDEKGLQSWTALKNLVKLL
jgi:hypothetical protein